MRSTEIVLTLDISSKTGWSLGEASNEGYRLIDYGLLGPIEKPELPYPDDYVCWAQAIFTEIATLIGQNPCGIIVIEETASGSKSNLSQKILEFVHYLVADFIRTNRLNVKYLMTGEWREAVSARMTKEEAKKNKKAKDIKAKTGVKLAKDENGKVIGKVTKKHVNVRRANELFGLSLKIKDNDKADAILLGRAYYEYAWNGFKRKSEREKENRSITAKEVIL